MPEPVLLPKGFTELVIRGEKPHRVAYLRRVDGTLALVAVE